MQTFAFRDRFLERGVVSFRVIHTSPVSSSAQAFRMRPKHLLAQSPSDSLHVYGQELTHTHLDRHIN